MTKPEDTKAGDPYLDTLAEPFRVKVVERIRLPSRTEREEILKRAFYSVAYLDSEDVYIDLATDSGTGAMSDEQWGAMMRGDEAYIRSRSYPRFERAVQDITGFANVVPTHQGRAAENILFNLLLEPGHIVLCNSHFDTTRAHVEHRKATPIDLVGDWLWDYDDPHPFKGNFDLERLRVALDRYHERVPFIIVTILNNFACSSPVSMENVRGVRALADRYGIPIYFDACRMAENAYFIKTREQGYSSRSITEIIREMLSYGSGCWMSAKKDAIVNIGGFLALRDEDLARKCQEQLVLFEGFPSYGGLARRDLEAIAVGLREGVDEEYLSHRVRLVEYLGRLLVDMAGVTVSRPIGGSGVFVDVESLYPHLQPEQLPGVALAADMYLEGAVRVGAITFHMNRVDADGQIIEKAFQFARFAVPRRVYTRSHVEYVARTMRRVKDVACHNGGYRVVDMPAVLGHFFAKFAPLE
jgi:tryptophanase